MHDANDGMWTEIRKEQVEMLNKVLIRREIMTFAEVVPLH